MQQGRSILYFYRDNSAITREFIPLYIYIVIYIYISPGVPSIYLFIYLFVFLDFFLSILSYLCYPSNLFYLSNLSI